MVSFAPQKNKIKMAQNRTFTMLKPDAVANGHIGAILEKINASGFRIVSLKMTQLTRQMLRHFTLFTQQDLFTANWFRT
jgi:nucleoside diphosphate kinase